jgi:hypothetical protein
MSNRGGQPCSIVRNILYVIDWTNHLNLRLVIVLALGLILGLAAIP